MLLVLRDPVVEHRSVYPNAVVKLVQLVVEGRWLIASGRFKPYLGCLLEFGLWTSVFFVSTLGIAIV